MALFNQTYIDIASQFGMPMFGIAGMPPFTGNYFWVDEANGRDGNTGGPQDPLKTISQALSYCTAGNNDVVFVSPGNSPGTGVHTTSTIAWNKNNTHLVGLSDPLKRGKRARISATGTTAFSPLLNVTGTGCWIKDVQLFTGFATDAQAHSYCVAEAGGRNCYDNVEILGFGAAGTAGNTGARAILISETTAHGENTFRDCVFGVDTISRGVANYTIEFGNGSARNRFIRCDFEMYCGAAATAAHILQAATTSVDRFQYFDDCTFTNAVKSAATTASQFAVITAGGGGYIMKDCMWVGATAWETSISNSFFWNNPAVAVALPGEGKNQTS